MQMSPEEDYSTVLKTAFDDDFGIREIQKSVFDIM